MENEKKFIFFDFDGVIADSFSAAFAVNKMIFPTSTEDDYRKRFEGNINEAASLKDEPKTDVDFFTEYTLLLPKCPIFEGMEEVVKKLAASHTLIIVSSTISDLIKEYLKSHQLDNYFTEVMGNDIHKSKITKIEMALSKYGMSEDDCLFITDTLGDIKEAHHVGIKAIAVTWGYQSRQTLELGQPSAIVDTPAELLEKTSF
jgi:HAD superfamily hydrolase (TIGR01549 family)